jgi:hypothetical protein
MLRLRIHAFHWVDMLGASMVCEVRWQIVCELSITLFWSSWNQKSSAGMLIASVTNITKHKSNSGPVAMPPVVIPQCIDLLGPSMLVQQMHNAAQYVSSSVVALSIFQAQN